MSDKRRRIEGLEHRLGSDREPLVGRIHPPPTLAQILAILKVLTDVGAIPAPGMTATQGDMTAPGGMGDLTRAMVEARLVFPPPDLDSELRAPIEG